MARQQWIVPIFRRGGELMDYEIYQAETGHKKKYLVFETRKAIFGEGITIAQKFFKCGCNHLWAQDVWVNGEDLYLENPHIEGFRKAYAISYYSNRRKD